MVHIEIEIAAPPEDVRAVISLATKNGTPVSCATSKQFPQHNNPTEFRWIGCSRLGAVGGEHYYGFQESKVTPGGTTFIHGEDHTGWLSVMFKPGWPMHSSVNEMYAGFARDLKRRVEEGEWRE
ncbi:uncharacterized protein BDR25DRAFT_312516 [Lindgomyces ingoldianus]|uniref:Uncharacterized protein n=1 Tax=Lindgomyces ingoldianus TaxID=673940 RepID=A0ACB6R3V2_9PLEO|nr:uncharacterized protein BDR25DRAFT_312516 [Lindgomyces ingoldianus]KAF2473455.1 hypothetical protein BDR25DRAFT_312516 [Lindgomyces ingoldianus]